jgi:hypothetical protein
MWSWTDRVVQSSVARRGQEFLQRRAILIDYSLIALLLLARGVLGLHLFRTYDSFFMRSSAG